MKIVYQTFALVVLLTLPAAAQPQGGFERSLPVTGPLDLDLISDSGGISVIRGGPGVVRIRAILKAQRNPRYLSDAEDRIRRIEEKPPIEQVGNRIRIGYVSDKALLKGISMRLEIEAPAETRLQAGADSGGIRVEGLKGPIECRTDSGGVTVRDIEGSVYARADSGGIQALRVAGDIDVATDSGGINIEQTKSAKITAQADSGGAKLRLANGGYDVRLSSDSGRVSTPALDPGSDVTRNHANGKLRGGGPIVQVTVDSGSIVVE